MSGLCWHGVNEQTCLECWRDNPTVPPKGEAAPGRSRVLHFGCGCRVALQGDGTVTNLQWCEEGHDESWGRISPAGGAVQLPISRSMFAFELMRHGGAYSEHSLADRIKCDDERCHRNRPAGGAR